MGGDVGHRGPRDRAAARRRGERARLDEVRRAMVITALHGFLGTPRDWDFLRYAGFPLVTPSVSGGPGGAGGARTRPPRSLATLGMTEGDVLLGYSRGGRLALQAL